MCFISIHKCARTHTQTNTPSLGLVNLLMTANNSPIPLVLIKSSYCRTCLMPSSLSNSFSPSISLSLSLSFPQLDSCVLLSENGGARKTSQAPHRSVGGLWNHSVTHTHTLMSRRSLRVCMCVCGGGGGQGSGVHTVCLVCSHASL